AERLKQQQQPLGAISVQEISSVRLKPTDGGGKMLAAKTMSAPPRAGVNDNNDNEREKDEEEEEEEQETGVCVPKDRCA
ncbi:Protein of unknown function, partial [Gryllus bimaculatus]